MSQSTARLRPEVLAIREESADNAYSTPAKPLPSMLTSGGFFLPGVSS